MPCRINRRRIWAHRIQLEALCHPYSSFWTLTYEKDPTTLTPKHTQNWLKRFRKKIEPLRIRYYLVGEYGDQTERPHYHVALFNYPGCTNGQSRYSKLFRNCCFYCDLVRDTWQHGHIYGGTIEDASANYIAGYVTKKLTRWDDERLRNRHPEFCRMSLRGGGLGLNALPEIASVLLEYDLAASQGDVPSSLRHGSRLLPLGRYLRQKLRLQVGMPAHAPASTLNEAQARLLPLLQTSIRNQTSLKMEVQKASDQKIKSLIAKSHIYRKRGSL